MQLKPSVQLPLVSPVGLLLVQPGLHTNALYPSKILQDGQVSPPDGVVGELDEAGTREIVALSAAFISPLGDVAAIEGTGSAVRPRRTLATLATTTVTGFVQQ